MNPEFWAGKSVLLTGHTGFKGSWLSLWLQKLGAQVTGYSLLPPTSPSLFEITKVADGMISITGDVRDLDHLKSCLTQYRPEIIVHMAAQSLVRFSYDNPVETYSINIIGTVNLLEAARFCKNVKVVIIVTSDKCYQEKGGDYGYRESDPLGGHDPYSSSKACAELVTYAYRNSYTAAKNRASAAIASVRAGNVIGGGDWARDRLIPDILAAFMAKRPALIRNPDAVRHWQHVLDPLNGYLSLAECLWNNSTQFAEAWNFGPKDDDAKPVSWIVDSLVKLWGNAACWERDRSGHPREAQYLKLDSTKAQTLIKWSPQLPLQTALEWTVEWYRAYRADKNMHELTENQINLYQKRLQK